MGERNKKINDQPDDLLASFSLAAIWVFLFFGKVVVGVLMLPLVVLVRLNDIGTRAIDAVRAFVNPEP